MALKRFPKNDVECLSCGKKFDTYIDSKGYHPKYCSHKCAMKNAHNIWAEKHKQVWITKLCAWCKKEFKVVERYPGYGKFCSHSCSSKAYHTGLIIVERVKVPCPICGEEFEANVNQIARGTKKTCSKKCGNILQGLKRRKGVDGSMASTYYQRKEVSAERGSCEICGYDKVPEILVMHHKDRNPKNGNPENISFICPNCHAIEHLNSGTGWFKKSDPRKSEKYLSGHRSDTHSTNANS